MTEPTKGPGPNPVARLREERHQDPVAFARLVGISLESLLTAERGSLFALPNVWRERFTGAGFDFSSLQAQYVAWRDRRNGVPATTLPEPRTEEDAKIAQAIQLGARGRSAIAQASGLSRTTVDAYLKYGTTERQKPEAVAL